MFKLFVALLVMTAILLFIGVGYIVAVICSKSSISDKIFALKALPVLFVCLVVILIVLWYSGVIMC